MQKKNRQKRNDKEPREKRIYSGFPFLLSGMQNSRGEKGRGSTLLCLNNKG
jgi:hypothetical protein